MAHAHTDVYAQPVEVRRDEDSIWIVCGNTRIVLRLEEAVALRDDLSRAITEAAAATSELHQAEGASV